VQRKCLLIYLLPTLIRFNISFYSYSWGIWKWRPHFKYRLYFIGNWSCAFCVSKPQKNCSVIIILRILWGYDVLFWRQCLLRKRITRDDT
jgi:hypothetical protein